MGKFLKKEYLIEEGNPLKEIKKIVGYPFSWK